MREEHLAHAVDALLDDVVGSGVELGLQVVVIRNGRTVVDAPRHVLLHTAGVPGLPAGTGASDLCDWDHMCAVIADAEPWWEPGTRFGYHAKTFGFLIGEIVRRATGETISTLLREHITGPLGVADEVHVGVPSSMLPRVARQVASNGPAPDRPAPGSPLARAMPPGVTPDPDYANRRDLLSADIPSEGTMSARGAARVYAACSAMNGSAAYADIDSGIAVAVMRNRFAAGDVTTTTRIDRLIEEELT